MSSIAEGLDALKAAVETEKKDREERPKVNWLSLKDGQSVIVQPLQELEEGSPNYSPERGQAYIAYYHQSPYDWQRQALCTKDEEDGCFACEINNKDVYTAAEVAAMRNPQVKAGDAKPWYRRKRFYINFLVTDPQTGEQEVKAFHCSTTSQGILGDLLEFYSANGPITDYVFSLSRKGEDRATSYTLTLRLKDKPVSLEGYKPEPTKEGGYLTIKKEFQPKFFKYPGATKTNPDGDADSVDELTRSTSELTW